MARYFASLAGGVFVPLATPKAAPPMALTAECVREHGEAIAEAIKVLADGAITPAERAAVVREIDESMRALASLRGVFAAEGGR